jgi:hypothetical protein
MIGVAGCATSDVCVLCWLPRNVAASGHGVLVDAPGEMMLSTRRVMQPTLRFPT